MSLVGVPSIAYLALGAGTGALLLFGAVQLTMFAVALRRGERLDAWQTAGLALAAAGVGWLLWPGLAAPPLGSAALMLAAGVAWGAYTLRGRGSGDPLADTAGNFLRGAPVALGVSLACLGSARGDPLGAAYAAASGALASGLGYAVWYAALRGLTATRAAAVQLAVPVLAAAGGVGCSTNGSGLPVITTHSNGAGGIITEGQEGFVISDPRDDQALVEKISLFMNRQNAERISIAARHLAESYSLERNWKEMNSILDEVSSNKGNWRDESSRKKGILKYLKNAKNKLIFGH